MKKAHWKVKNIRKTNTIV